MFTPTELFTATLRDIQANPRHQRIKIFDRLKRKDDTLSFTVFNELIEHMLKIGYLCECRSANNNEPQGTFFGLAIPTNEYKDEASNPFMHLTFGPSTEQVRDLLVSHVDEPKQPSVATVPSHFVQPMFESYEEEWFHTEV
tara:strand:- start:417 stop:839 length:423 start_codon:yes stop_codon:yes gene_type:complete